jgi:lipocalin
VVRDIVKAYYDKKNKKNQGQITAENKGYELKKDEARQVAEVAKVVAKPEEAAVVVPTGEKKSDR